MSQHSPSAEPHSGSNTSSSLLPLLVTLVSFAYLVAPDSTFKLHKALLDYPQSRDRTIRMRAVSQN